MNLDEQIIDLKEVIAEKEMYERKLKKAEAEYEEAKQKEIELKEILEKEKKDVQKLESFTLFNIWCSMFGSKAEKLEQEKYELSQAEYKYKIIKTTLMDLEEEIESLKCKLGTIKNNEMYLHKLYEQKEQEILALAGKNSSEIKKLNEEINCKKAEIQELEEAIEAGKNLTTGLRNSLVNLEKASRLGTWDVFGGGVLVDVIKHSYINQAKRNLEDLKYLADKFARELNDVNFVMNLNIDIGGLLSFSDWFFDGFFVDMFMKSRIDETRVKLEKQIKQVEDAISALSARHAACVDEIANITDAKRSLLI
jgi:prefoldin subunit 5